MYKKGTAYIKCNYYPCPIQGVTPRHIFTTRKRSLGQGNVFTPVSFCSQGEGVCPIPSLQADLGGGLRRPPCRQTCVWGAGWPDSLDGDPLGRPYWMQTPRMQTPSRQTPSDADPIPRIRQQAGGTHSTGMHTCFSTIFDIYGQLSPYHFPKE